MKNKILQLVLVSSIFISPVWSKTKSFESGLLDSFKREYSAQKDVDQLKEKTLAAAGKSVPVLIKVMKDGKFPVKNRWMATFLLGRIAGKKASPLLAKFTQHPNWLMRVAGLKTLLHLGDKKHVAIYKHLLKDNSMIVRSQALDNIQKLGLKSLASDVWSMLYSKQNYHDTKNGFKRSNILKKVIRVVGDLKFKDATDPMLKMIRDKKYSDLLPDLDYSLSRITGSKSSGKTNLDKTNFWKNFKTT